MARPRNFEDELIRCDNQIERTQKTLNDLLEERKQIIRSKEMFEMRQLSDLLKKSGKSYNELLAFLQEDNIEESNESDESNAM